MIAVFNCFRSKRTCHYCTRHPATNCGRVRADGHVWNRLICGQCATRNQECRLHAFAPATPKVAMTSFDTRERWI